MFDIALPGESDGTVNYHKSVAPARSLKPTSLKLPGLVETSTHKCELCIHFDNVKVNLEMLEINIDKLET